MMEIIDFLLTSLFTGFGIFILFTSFIRFKDSRKPEWIINLTDSAILIVRFTAIIFLLTWLFYVIERYNEDSYSMLDRMFGPYWFGYWTYPFSYGLFPQLFWIKYFRKKIAVRLISALLILFALYIEKFVIWVTSFHRDYVPSNWTLLPESTIFYDLFVQVMIFAIFLGLTHFLRSSFKRQSA